MTYDIGILTIGSELLDGRVQDTNANFICNELNSSGLNVSIILTCPDNLGQIKNSLSYLIQNCSHIIISGGLGPTSDDLTREAVAEFFNKPLKLDQEAFHYIKNIFKNRRRQFEPSNEKQALFPEGSTVINNPNGTAPGFWMEFKNHLNMNASLSSLPGVPGELKAMISESVIPKLKTRLVGITPLKKLTFKIFGLPESVVGARIKELQLSDDIIVSYRASFPEIHLVLKFPDNKYDSLDLNNRIVAAIGSEWIFTKDLAQSFENTIHELLISKGITIGTAESCTAGGISNLLTNSSGASSYFLGSINCYSNQLKERLLKVPSDIILKFGAVSKNTAIEMANNARKIIGCDIALAITGIAGPEGGTKEKPVGTFFIAIASIEGCSAYHYFYPGSRARVRSYASYMTLDLLRRHLLNIPPQIESPISQDA